MQTNSKPMAMVYEVIRDLATDAYRLEAIQYKKAMAESRIGDIQKIIEKPVADPGPGHRFTASPATPSMSGPFPVNTAHSEFGSCWNNYERVPYDGNAEIESLTADIVAFDQYIALAESGECSWFDLDTVFHWEVVEELTTRVYIEMVTSGIDGECRLPYICKSPTTMRYIANFPIATQAKIMNSATQRFHALTEALKK